jgi:hypothetical protein
MVVRTYRCGQPYRGFESDSLRHDLSIRRYCDISNLPFANCPTNCGTSYGLADDAFHAETNSCGICGTRHASVSFAECGGTAVSRFSKEFALGERDANEETDKWLPGHITTGRRSRRPFHHQAASKLKMHRFSQRLREDRLAARACQYPLAAARMRYLRVIRRLLPWLVAATR